MVKLIIKLDKKIVDECQVEKNVTIGRKKSDIVLKNPAVSSTHANLVIEDGHYILHDLKSTNGTFVNKGRIASQELHHGDVITIGKFELEFINPDEMQSDSFFDDDSDGNTIMINTEDLMLSGKAKEESSGSAHARLCLVGKLAEKSDKRVEYKLKKETTLMGSGKNVDIHLKGFTIAGVSAVIRREGKRYFIKSLGGWSKLKLNDKAPGKEVELKTRDKIKIGPYLFLFIV